MNVDVKKIVLVALLLILVGCTAVQLKNYRRVIVGGEAMLDSPVGDLLKVCPIGPFLGLIGVGMGLIKNVLDRRIESKNSKKGNVMSETKFDARNIISKLVGSKKYMMASIISVILLGINSHYQLNIEAALIAKIISGLFGVVIVMNGIEDYAEKR